MDDELPLALTQPAASRLAARVLLDGGGDLQFDYIIPAELADCVFVGSRAEVPLRHTPKPGTVLEILPNHACATAAQFAGYTLLRAGVPTGEQWARLNGW